MVCQLMGILLLATSFYPAGDSDIISSSASNSSQSKGEHLMEPNNVSVGDDSSARCASDVCIFLRITHSSPVSIRGNNHLDLKTHSTLLRGRLWYGHLIDITHHCPLNIWTVVNGKYCIFSTYPDKRNTSVLFYKVAPEKDCFKLQLVTFIKILCTSMLNRRFEMEYDIDYHQFVLY